MINVEVVTPTGKKYIVGVEGALVRELVHVFDEIEDLRCQAWIYGKLNGCITNSTPGFTGTYLGYIWKKA